MKDVQSCIAACSNDQKCEAFAMISSSDSGEKQCYISNGKGSESLLGTEVMVKQCNTRCSTGCPHGFTTIGNNGGCYHVELGVRKNWMEAEHACRNLNCGAHLVTLETQQVRFL